MQVFEALKQAVKACADVVKWGAGIQEPARKGLAADLQAICTNCDAAYDAVLTRLVPIKNAFADPTALAFPLTMCEKLVLLCANCNPDHLCGQVDQLLIRLSSNLDPLKYSIDCRRIDDVRQYLQRFGNFDGAIFQSYDELVAELDRIATQIQTSASDKEERSRYAQHVIQGFESDLRATQSAVRDAKTQTIDLI